MGRRLLQTLTAIFCVILLHFSAQIPQFYSCLAQLPHNCQTLVTAKDIFYFRLNLSTQPYQFTGVTLTRSRVIIRSQEELNVALFHIKDVSSRQREVQKRIELLQSENAKDVISVPHRYGRNVSQRYIWDILTEGLEIKLQISCSWPPETKRQTVLF